MWVCVQIHRMYNTTHFKVNPKMKKTGKEFQDSESRKLNQVQDPSEPEEACQSPVAPATWQKDNWVPRALTPEEWPELENIPGSKQELQSEDKRLKAKIAE